MADKKTLFIFPESSGSSVNNINLTDDSLELISSALTSLYVGGNATVKSYVIDFLESSDGQNFGLIDNS